MLWSDLQKLRPKNLKISPVAVVPQVGRRGRIILDLSFPVWQKNSEGVATVIQKSVNETTALNAPKGPVKEIGKVLPRLLRYMRDVPPEQWILFSKLDISDGFWRLIVKGDDCYNFAYVLPQKPGEPTRIVVPSAVQMGWVESPPYFCAVTETARDLTEFHIQNRTLLPANPIEQQMDVQHVPMKARADKPSRCLQVYVDDFCLAATQSKDERHIPTISRAGIHSIHSVFPPPEVTGHENGKPPLSPKKLDKGDGQWRVKKEKLGFEWNGRRRTVRLPKEKAKKYVCETKTMLHKKRAPIKKFQTAVGRLRHAAVILPAAAGFFTPINNALKPGDDGRQRSHIGLGLRSEVREVLLDLTVLLKLLSRRPTHVREIVPEMPKFAGYHDAAAEGGGGVWFSLQQQMQPLLWRLAFPEDIKKSVVSLNNQGGTITNSDLELAAEVCAIAVILYHAPIIRHQALGTLCDNTPTVSWITKMASKANTPISGRLIRGLAILLYCHHAGPLLTLHVPGDDNTMADIASRPTKAKQLFRRCTNSDDDFTSAFSSEFPLPDGQTWRLVTIQDWIVLNIFETLRGKRLEMQRWMGPNGSATGKRGNPTLRPTISTSTSGDCQQKKELTPCSRLLLPSGEESTVTKLRSVFSQSAKLCDMSPKPLFWPESQTPDGSLPQGKNSTSPSRDS